MKPSPDDDEEWGFFVLLRATYERSFTVIPGSSVVRTNCGHRAFVSPDGVRFLETDARAEGLYIMCDVCSVEDDKQAQHQKELAIPGVIASITEHLGIGAGDQVAAMMRDKGIEQLE